jgi:16S rRNA (uracil1498-N3)-methyltransferase
MHQLFIVDTLEKKGNQIFLSDCPDLLDQLRKVLRAKIGDTFFVQQTKGEHLRYEITISSRTDKTLQGEILREEPLHLRASSFSFSSQVTLLVALPNKREKAEWIVQKLSEIGVREIVFRLAERSILRQRNEKKESRLLKIAKEATEQSRGIEIPEIRFDPSPLAVVVDKSVVVFDCDEKKQSSTDNPHISPLSASKQTLLGIV